MNFDWTEHMRQQARWLLTLAATQGWKDYAEWKRQEFRNDELYGQAFLTVLAQERASASSSPSAPAEDSMTASTGARGTGA